MQLIKQKPLTDDEQLATCQHIVERARTEIVALATEEETLTRRRDALAAERSNLVETHAASQRQVAQARQEVQRLTDFFNNASTYAESATGTPGEQQARASQKEAAKLLSASQATLASLEESFARQVEQTKTRFNELDKDISAAQERLTAIHAKLPSLHATREKAHKEQGDVLYRKLLHAAETLESSVRIQEQQRETAQKLFDTFRSEAMSQLREWPDKARELAAKWTFRDSMTEVIQAWITVFSAITGHGSMMSLDELSTVTGMNIDRLADALIVDYGEVMSLREPFMVMTPTQEKLAILRVVLQQYREAKAQ